MGTSLQHFSIDCIKFVLLLSLIGHSESVLGVGICTATKNKGEWSYLYENDSFSIRQRLIVSILKKEGVNRVIEIGGFCTPICKYYPEIMYTNIDPYLDKNDAICKHQELFKESIEDIDFKKLDTKDPFAMVYVGVWLENLKKPVEDMEFLKQAFAKAKLVFIEAVFDPKGRAPFETLKKMATEAGLKEQFGAKIKINKGITKSLRYERYFYYFKR